VPSEWHKRIFFFILFILIEKKIRAIRVICVTKNKHPVRGKMPSMRQTGKKLCQKHVFICLILTLIIEPYQKKCISIQKNVYICTRKSTRVVVRCEKSICIGPLTKFAKNLTQGLWYWCLLLLSVCWPFAAAYPKHRIRFKVWFTCVRRLAMPS